MCIPPRAHGVACRSVPRWQSTTWCCASLMTHARPPAGHPSVVQCALGVYTHSCHYPYSIPAAHTTGILVSLVLCAGTPGWQRGYACMERLGTLATILSERNGTERNGSTTLKGMFSVCARWRSAGAPPANVAGAARARSKIGLVRCPRTLGIRPVRRRSRRGRERMPQPERLQGSACSDPRWMLSYR
jgi:hypothetical protein